MATKYFDASPVASSVPFDNTTNGFSADNVQSAIEEAQTLPHIPEYATDPVSPTTNSTWILRGQTGTPIGLLLALTQETNDYQLSYKTVSGKIVRTLLT